MSKLLRNKKRRRNQKIYKSIIYLTIFIVIITIFGAHIKSSSTNSDRAATPLPKEVFVTLTKKGFSPKNITIAKGSAVRWINNSGTNNASVNSDNYPTNMLHPELNLGQFNNGSTLAHIFVSAGKYSYHDQFQPKLTGAVIVK